MNVPRAAGRNRSGQVSMSVLSHPWGEPAPPPRRDGWAAGDAVGMVGTARRPVLVAHVPSCSRSRAGPEGQRLLPDLGRADAVADGGVNLDDENVTPQMRTRSASSS